jgi:hypothetical protein
MTSTGRNGLGIRQSLRREQIGIAEKFDFDTVREHFGALIDGLREGFGLKEWGEAVKSIAGQFDAGSIARWLELGGALPPASASSQAV